MTPVAKVLVDAVEEGEGKEEEEEEEVELLAVADREGTVEMVD